MSERVDVAIVGGGISGLALAFELARSSRLRVAVLERRYPGSGASSRNVGRIRAMQLTPELARVALLAQRKHERLTDELGSNTLFWRAGYAWVLYEQEEVERMTSLLPMFREVGIRRPAVHLGREVERALPVLRGGEPAAGAIVGRDGVGHHDAVVYAYLRACRGLGVEVGGGETVLGLAGDGDDALVRTDRRELRAGRVVNAAGGWARELSALAGVAAPNAPLRREVLVTEPSRPFMSAAVTFYRPVEGWFNQTLRGELVAGVVAPDEPPGMNQASTFAFLARTCDTLMRKAPRVGRLRVIRQWGGVYDMTPDRKPLVGPVGRMPWFVQMNGYSGRGFALAPLLAELLARWIATGSRPEELAPFDPDRFDGVERQAITATDYYAAYAPRDDGAP
jgi:sarcosine oxidase subunit beta